MPRHCALTGKAVRFGHKVSHSNRKSSRRFAANIQKVSLPSEALGRTVRLPISTRALRTLQKHGGLDAFLLRTADEKLPTEGLRLTRAVRKALS